MMIYPSAHFVILIRCILLLCEVYTVLWYTRNPPGSARDLLGTLETILSGLRHLKDLSMRMSNGRLCSRNTVTILQMGTPPKKHPFSFGTLWADSSTSGWLFKKVFLSFFLLFVCHSIEPEKSSEVGKKENLNAVYDKGKRKRYKWETVRV